HRARTGKVNAKDLHTLNKQVGKPTDVRISLAGANRQADIINQQNLQAIDAEPVEFIADKWGEWPALPADEILTLKVGAQVMVRANGADRPPNIKVPHVSKVVNGTLGIVTGTNKEAQTVEVLTEAGDR